MPLTLDQLLLLPLGYLSGADLARWCSPQLLTKQEIVSPGSIQQSASLAYSKIISTLINRYDIKKEMAFKAPLQGTGTASLTDGGVSGISVNTAGGAYATAPNVTLVGGAGAGAMALAVLTDGVLTGITVSAPGAGYTSAPIVVITGGLAPDPREQFLVQLVSTIAVRNVLGSSQNVSDFQMGIFKQTEKDLLDIRNAQMNLALNPVPTQSIDPVTRLPYPYPESDAVLVGSNFKYLG